MQPDSRHQCIVYAGAPSRKLPTMAAIMYRMMLNGYRCLYMNSPAMVAGIRSYLAAMGIDVAHEHAEAHILFSSEPVTEGGIFDVDRMLQKLESELDNALKAGYKGLWASGDMTWEFGHEKNWEKVIEYEWKLEALFHKRKELRGICQYHCDTLPKDVVRKGLMMHGAVVTNETLTHLNPSFIQSSALPVEENRTDPSVDKVLTELCNGNPPPGE